jgi:hypothetical protein
MLAAMWIFDKNWPRLGWHLAAFAIASIAIIIGTSVLFRSNRCWIDWLGAFRELGGKPDAFVGDNCSLAHLLRDKRGPAVAMVVTLFVPAVFVLCVALGRQRTLLWDTSQQRRVFNIIALGCAIPLLASPLAWLHYFVLGTPLLLLAFRTRNTTLLGFFLGAIAILLFCLSPLTNYVLWLNDPDSVAARMCAAILIVSAMAVIELARSSNPAVQALSSAPTGDISHASSQIR